VRLKVDKKLGKCALPVDSALLASGRSEILPAAVDWRTHLTADLLALKAKPDFCEYPNAGLFESHPHGALITKEMANFQVLR